MREQNENRGQPEKLKRGSLMMQSEKTERKSLLQRFGGRWAFLTVLCFIAVPEFVFSVDRYPA